MKEIKKEIGAIVIQIMAALVASTIICLLLYVLLCFIGFTILPLEPIFFLYRLLFVILFIITFIPELREDILSK